MTAQHHHPLWKLLDQIQMNHRQLGAQIVELRAMIAAMQLESPVEHRCHCGWQFRNLHELQEHAYQHHDGPLPTAWQLADRRAGDAA